MFGGNPGVTREKVVFLIDGKEVWSVDDPFHASFMEIPQKDSFVYLPRDVVDEEQDNKFWVRKVETTYVKRNTDPRIWSEVIIFLE